MKPRPRRRVLPRLLAVCLVAAALAAPTAGPSRAEFDPDGWNSIGQVLESGQDGLAARVEPMPDGGLIALVVADGDDHGFPGEHVLVSRERSGDGTWDEADVVALGTGNLWGRTFESFADTAGRVVAIWAEKDVTPNGQWTVRSVTRDLAGSWGTVETLYTTRTNGALSDTNEANAVRPNLARNGGALTVAWASVVGAPTARTLLEETMFHTRTWAAGAWGTSAHHDGWSPDAATIRPVVADEVYVHGDPRFAVRPTDGRISILYTLEKQRDNRTMAAGINPNGTEGEINVDHVWDGVAEPDYLARSESAFVLHVDAGGWNGPHPMVTSAGPIVGCNPPDLPSNPPLVAHWAEWKSFSQNPGIIYSCPAVDSTPTLARYAPDGTLQAALDHKAEPTVQATINQFLDDACDDNNDWCFDADDWGSTDWGINWEDARIAIAPGSDQPAPDAVQQNPWPTTGNWATVPVTGGSITVTDGVGDDGKAITFDRSTGADVTWTPNPGASGRTRVTHAFSDGGDVAVFYHYVFNGNALNCGFAVLHAGSTTVDTSLTRSTCVGHTNGAEDATQLTDGSIVIVDGDADRAPVVRLAAGFEPPAPTTFTKVKAPSITGKLKVGKKLTAKPGTWDPVPQTTGYQWFKGNKKIAGATKKILKLTKALKGKKISVQITLKKPGVTTKKVKVTRKGKVKK